jgi:hypothetical protein
MLAMRKLALRKPALLAAACLCAAAPDFAAAQTQSPPRAAEVLFVQSASGVAFVDGVLTLKDVSPTTVFFTDRPERAAGHVRNDRFLGSWTEGKNSFKANPPNASLSFFDAQGGRPALAVVVLSNPRTDGRNLLYDARPLQGAIPARADAATLFIDGMDAPCTPTADLALTDSPCWVQRAFRQ